MTSRMNGISRIYSCRSLLFQTHIIFFILLSLTRRWTVLLWAIGSCVLFEILRAILSYDNVFLSTHRHVLLITFFIYGGIIRSCRLQSFLKTRWYSLSVDVFDGVWYIWIAKVMHLLRHNQHVLLIEKLLLILIQTLGEALAMGLPKIWLWSLAVSRLLFVI